MFVGYDGAGTTDGQSDIRGVSLGDRANQLGTSPGGDRSLAIVLASQLAAAGESGGFVRKWRTMRNKDNNFYFIEISI